MRPLWPVIRTALGSRLVYSIGLVGLLCLMLPGSLRADTFTYTYTGNPFSYNGSGYAITSITGSLTLSSPLAVGTTTTLGLASLGGTITGYAFTDGGPNTSDLANYSLTGFQSSMYGDSQFTLTTDASGQIVAWYLAMYNTSNGIIVSCTVGTGLYCPAGGEANDGTDVYNNYVAYNYGDPGSWAETTAITSAPEPGTDSLVLFGVGVVLVMRRRIA